MSRTVESSQTQLRNEYDVDAQPVDGPEFKRLNQLWLERYCPNVKRKTGSWVYRGYRWHAYSFGHESALQGVDALDAYTARRATSFCMYFEFDDLLFDCNGPPSPDFRPLQDDVYVFPPCMDWTFVLTHEMSMDLGPYFAEPLR